MKDDNPLNYAGSLWIKGDTAAVEAMFIPPLGSKEIQVRLTQGKIPLVGDTQSVVEYLLISEALYKATLNVFIGPGRDLRASTK